MDGLCMSRRKVAAVALVVLWGLVIHVGEPLDSMGTGSPLWRKTGLIGAPTRAVVCVVAGISLLILGWLHRLLFCPLELLRSPDDVGYIAEDGRSRAQAANEVRRRRKIGELPPIYPNGWYRVMDSHMLQVGEVKNATVLGMITANIFPATAVFLCGVMAMPLQSTEIYVQGQPKVFCDPGNSNVQWDPHRGEAELMF